MSSPDLVLGVDASTTAVKVIAFDRAGNPLAEGRAPLSLSQPHPAWHEQSAAEWWKAFCQACQAVMASIAPRRLAGVCIAHQRETFVLVDEAGKPLRPAIVWMDERARPLLPELEAQYGKEHFHTLTGKPLTGNLLPGKLAWLRQHEPEVYARIHKILDVQAYLVFQLTGLFRTSAGSADPMGLFDMPSGAWSEQVLAAVGLSSQHMPQAFLPGSLLGAVSTAAAVACGLPASLPVFAGTGDGQAGGLGAGLAHPGESYLNLGTAVVSGSLATSYLTSPAFRTHYAAIPGAFALETVILGGTYTNRWFAENFASYLAQPGRATEEVLDEIAGKVPPGALGLLLVPYWNTALNPYWDAGASGVVVGWRGVHQPAHMYRAILEGMAFEQRLATEGVEQATGQRVERYIAFGGGARSTLWCQIMADVTARRVVLAHAPEATALGAGILAAAAAGIYPDVIQAAQAMTRLQPEHYQPDPKRAAFYDRLYSEVYRHLFPALQPLLDRLTSLADYSEEA
jgi:sugar (pentulose or hexulose) kinase